MKGQIEALSDGYKMVRHHNKKMKKKLEEEEENQKNVMSSVIKYKKKSDEYDELIPKIDDLGQLHDGMLKENSELKQKTETLENLMKNILKTLGKSQN